MHHELGGGFCRKHHHVGGVSVCVYRSEVYVGTLPRDETVVLVREPFDRYHLPHDGDGQERPACRPAVERRAKQVSLRDAVDRDLDLCEDCAAEARHRYALFKNELREEWEGYSDE